MFIHSFAYASVRASVPHFVPVVFVCSFYHDVIASYIRVSMLIDDCHVMIEQMVSSSPLLRFVLAVALCIITLTYHHSNGNGVEAAGYDEMLAARASRWAAAAYCDPISVAMWTCEVCDGGPLVARPILYANLQVISHNIHLIIHHSSPSLHALLCCHSHM
jgi:hypothetical protein